MSRVDDPQLEVLLACFDGHKRAGKSRRDLDRRIKERGATVLDEVVVRVNQSGNAQVYDPHRVVAGTLTSALTWGVFGLLASGGLGLIVWGVLGTICGGGYAYVTEHLLTKTELRRMAKQLAPGSSALVAWIASTEVAEVLGCVSKFEPTSASIAAIGADPTAVVTRSDTTEATKSDALVSMLLVRYTGARTAQQVWTEATGGKVNKDAPIQTELLVTVDANNKARVNSPTQGTRAMSKSDIISWGLFGVVFGAIAGVAGGGGILGFLEDGIVTGLAWAIFGLVAGALYGLWAGRGISARRLRGIGPLLAPDTSFVLAWADGAVTNDMVTPWTRPNSTHLALAFGAVDHGAVLAA
jgi:uncharacterized membrane protein